MKHLKEHLMRDRFQVVGLGPSYDDMRKIARGLLRVNEALVQTKHKFFFCVDRITEEALIMWFAGDRLHQRKMDLKTAGDLLTELEKSQFKLEELN
jgi:hypothetical protein